MSIARANHERASEWAIDDRGGLEGRPAARNLRRRSFESETTETLIASS